MVLADWQQLAQGDATETNISDEISSYKSANERE